MARFPVVASIALLSLLRALPGPAAPAPKALPADLRDFYVDLHQHPELSLHEEKTAAKVADRLRQAGFEVTAGVGGTGVVGRAQERRRPHRAGAHRLDALPVEEKTGLPYASTVRVKDDAGTEVPVMHACGHDVHMTAPGRGPRPSWRAARTDWQGTLVFIGQPAEETVRGARAMLKDGLFTRFPKPDFALALHDTPTCRPASIGLTSGYALANSDSVDIDDLRQGGPRRLAARRPSIPIVIAARTVLALQTIVAREKDPLDPAVVTVGSIHGGTKHNIIPDEVKLQLTVRAYKEEVRKHILAAIERIAKAEAAAAGAPKEPAFAVVESCPATYNDPKLTARIAAALRRTFGDGNVVDLPPQMASEDFSEYGLAGVPAVQWSLGAGDPAKLKELAAAGQQPPSLHSSLFAPDRDPTIATGVEAEVAVLMDLLGKP